MSHDSSKWLFLSFAASAVLLGRIIPAACEKNMPQVRGDDVLTQVLGETRLAVSQMLLDKADEYFHGGVRHTDCEHEGTAMDHDEHDQDQDEEECAAHERFDPWRMINRRVHVQEHRHMHGAEATELLPWLWAASHISAENLQALESTAYVLNRMLGNPGAAVELLEQGIAKNPVSAELEFSLGELHLHAFNDVVKAEAAFRSALEKNLLARDASDEDTRLLRLRTLFYLGYLSKLKGDTRGLRQCLREAEELSPQHVCTNDLRKLLEEGASRR